MNFKERVLKGEALAGTHTGFDNSLIAEVMGCCGYDYIWIDTEHASVDPSKLQNMITAVQGTGSAAIVRVPLNDMTCTKHLLEMGPDGIIFPMINTAEEAERVIKMTMYPPLGIRGFGPLRATRCGLIDTDEYIKNIDKHLCRFIQIETETAVKNLPEIVKNPYIDGYILGPCDLSGSIGELGNIYGERTTALIKEAVKIVKGAGKSIGVSTGSDSPEVIKYWYDMGMTLISAGADYLYVSNAAKQNYENMKKIYKGEM